MTDIEKADSFLKIFRNVDAEKIGVLPFVVLMLVSLVVALFVSFLYEKFYRNRATGSQIHRSFPLLGVSITAIFICIQFSLPLSLGLLGALSIVRFRTPIKEPEEIGFLMLVIATSICCATFNMVFLSVILAVALIGLIALNYGPRFVSGRHNDGVLLITVPKAEYKDSAERLLDYLDENVARGKVESILENKDASVVTYSFNRIDPKELLKIESGLKEISAGLTSNIFFNRAGDV